MPTSPYLLNSNPALDAFAITPSDASNFAAPARGLYVGGAGDVSLVTLQGNTVVLSGVPAGTFMPVACLRVNATGTTATGLVGLL